MTKEEILNDILSLIRDYLETLEEEVTTEVDESTPLLGDEGLLDSMGLVEIVLDLETDYRDRGHEITLTDEKAMSRRNSPFRSASVLADFIFEQMGDGNG